MKAVILVVATSPQSSLPATYPKVVATGNDTFVTSVAGALNAAFATAPGGGTVDLDNGDPVSAEVVTLAESVVPGDQIEIVSGLYKKHVTV